VKTIGLFEAKTRLSELCGKVAETGEVYTITRRGRPIARIEPVAPRASGSAIWDGVEVDRRKFGPAREDLVLPKRRVHPRKDLFG
jgi:prevent-host-death family protein